MLKAWETIRKWCRWENGLIPAAVLFFLLFAILFQVHLVSGDSMQPALRDGSIVFMRKAGYRPQHGDVVICKPKQYGKALVKRIAGMGGDVLDISGSGVLIRNGERIDEPYARYANAPAWERDAHAVILPGMFYLLGDNRGYSLDSRAPAVGQVNENDIVCGAPSLVRIY